MPLLDFPPPVALFRLIPLFLALWGLAMPAYAEDRPLQYRVSRGGDPVGTRKVSLQYLPGEEGEIRLVSAWTEILAPLPGGRYTFEQRLGGRFGGSRSFSSSLRENGRTREVQGHLSPQGEWVVTVVERGGARSWDLPQNAIDLTSLELLDPQRALRTFQDATNLRLLVTETGAVLEGPVTDLGTGELRVGDDTVQVHRFRWEPPAGAMVFAWNDEGILISSALYVGGFSFEARLQELPPPRTFDNAMEAPLVDQEVVEEEL